MAFHAAMESVTTIHLKAGILPMSAQLYNPPQAPASQALRSQDIIDEDRAQDEMCIKSHMLFADMHAVAKVSMLLPDLLPVAKLTRCLLTCCLWRSAWRL